MLVSDLIKQFSLADETATGDFAAACATCFGRGLMVFLQGDLGAGKTTLVRAWLRALGYAGAVRSPTYTLIEPYPLVDLNVYHLDLYRLGDPEELELLGLRDYLDGSQLVLVEWPDQGEGFLGQADVIIELSYRGQGEDEGTGGDPGGDPNKGREVRIQACTENGRQAISCAGIDCFQG